ncbi:MAG: choice-of-anchor J domain-containing protein, partial [Endomicrobiaceae bacterium]
VTPMIPVYNPARNLLATSTYGLIVLNWEAPFEHTRGLRQAQRRETNNQVFESYTLYRNDEILAEEITDLIYADYDVQNGINYNYYVITNYSNPVGQSEASNSVISTPVIPTPATNFTALAGDSVVELTWEGPGFNRISGSRTNGSGFDGYYIYRDDVKLNTTPLQSFAYVDSAVVNYTSYTYYVTAVYHNPQAEIESAPTVSQTVMPELLIPPSNLQATVLEYDVTLTWQEPNLPRNSRNLIGYNIYRDGVLQNQQLINNTNYVNVNVPVGPHTYTVTAVYDAQESVPSEAIEVTVIPLGDYTFPPVNVITSLNGNNIIVRWEAPFTYTGNLSNLLGYNVYRHLIEDNARTNAEFELLTETPITDLRFIDVNLEPGEYNYSVSAVYFINEEVQESELISSLPVVIDDLLPPTNLTYEFDEFAELDVILHWEAPAVETDRTVQSYKVYHNSIMLAQVTDLTYRHINAGIGIHEYAVSAVYNTGESAPLTIEVEINSQVIDEFPYVQGFEGNVLPLGWKTPFTGNVNGKWRQRNNEDFAYEGQKSVMSGNDFGQYWLVVNPVEITNESNTLSFFARDHSNITSMDKTDEFLHIKISTTNDSLYNFTSLATLDYRSLTTQYQQFMFDLSSYIGQTVYIALERVSTGGNYVYVDNFSFNNEELPVFNAPQNVVAQAGENIVNLEWQAPVVTETHILLAYQVYKNDDLVAELIANPEQTTYTYSDADVQAFTSYDYMIKAVYTQGVASSETVQAMPYTLNSATDLIATSGDMQIALAWQAPVMNTSRNSISSSKYNRLSASNQRNLDLTLQGYQVYRNNIAITETVSDAEFVDTNVMPGVTYRYYVKAVYNLGVSSASNTAQAVAYQLIAPHTLTATEGLNRITLNWQYGISLVRNNKNELKSNQGQMKFNVYKDGEILASSITSRFYQDNAVVAGEEHTYYVTAVYRQGESQASESVTAEAYDLQAPRELMANAGNRQVELVWTAPTYMNDDFFVGYKVYRNGVVIVENITDLTYTDLNLQANIVYNYCVSAV